MTGIKVLRKAKGFKGRRVKRTDRCLGGQKWRIRFPLAAAWQELTSVFYNQTNHSEKQTDRTWGWVRLVGAATYFSLSLKKLCACGLCLNVVSITFNIPYLSQKDTMVIRYWDLNSLNLSCISCINTITTSYYFSQCLNLFIFIPPPPFSI